ncbi:MAG: hypothetical protein U9R58_06170 [Chloroflexota bacterium]|nr:hypothetical protein [Chloroflexota bacterium]
MLADRVVCVADLASVCGLACQAAGDRVIRVAFRIVSITIITSAGRCTLQSIQCIIAEGLRLGAAVGVSVELPVAVGVGVCVIVGVWVCVPIGDHQRR